MAYAYLAPLHDPDGKWGEFDRETGGVVLPPALPLTMQSIDPRGAYLIDTGRIFVILLGAHVEPKFLADVFGTDPSKPPSDKSELNPEPVRPGSALSKRVVAVLEFLRSQKHTWQVCYVVQQGTVAGDSIQHVFIEDRRDT